MTNAFSLFRSLIIYSVCLPLAIVVGYLLATPLDLGSLVAVSIMLALLTIPLFLRWHYPWMLLFWNLNAVAFFLPGRPQVSWLLILISFMISGLQFILNREMKFISVPSVTKPLLFIFLVVIVTARLTGGIGLNALGASDSVGGKRYVILFLGIIGYFALTAFKIPPYKRKLYIFLYLIGSLSQVIANFAYLVSPSFSFIFLVFPTDVEGVNALSQSPLTQQPSITRMGGLAIACFAIISLMLAFHGIRGMFDLRKFWRFPVLLACCVATLFGGYRSQVIIVVLTLGIMFYMEGLMRSRLVPILVLGFIMGTALVVPFVQKMPLVVQRSLAFLPIDIDYEAAQNAKGSSDWRFQMWLSVLPTIPQYLILGKGEGINIHELDMQRDRLNLGDETAHGAIIAGDYHNGPLSVIIPFGIFGTAGFIWFLVAGYKVLQRNYKYGDSDLLLINRFFLATYIVKIITFFLIFGAFVGDLMGFATVVGFSIALNHGVAQPVAEPVTRPVFHKFRLVDVPH